MFEPLSPGTILWSRYRIVQLVGRGGMGAIYQAEDLRLEGRLCAIKEVIPEPDATLERREQLQAQFYREATILARLDHPNLPKVSDYFTEGERDYLVMDFVPGRDLRELIEEARAKREFLAEEQVLAWAEQLFDALEFLHGQEPPLLHRDIKPANIKLTPAGTIKLVDFGLAKLMTPEDESTVTVLQGRGSVQYTPLEQYGGESGHTDVRSDVYAAGATLYHLLTGQPPVDAKQRFLKPDALIAPRALNPEISPHVERAILHAMAMHPDDRPASIAALRAELLGNVEGVPGNLQTSHKVFRAENGSPRLLPRNRAMAIDSAGLREALWQNRLLLLLLGLLLTLAIVVTALSAERSETSGADVKNIAPTPADLSYRLQDASLKFP
ncbi:MAG: serine/threonine protein kinase [Ardenticatenia bacterium]|jgi:serine/threonine-protein kinase|nr:MAG: serine/threonine protein kinase [Ardenticatenia bacterium]